MQLEAVSSITSDLGEETNPHLTAASFQAAAESDKVFAKHRRDRAAEERTCLLAVPACCLAASQCFTPAPQDHLQCRGDRAQGSDPPQGSRGGLLFSPLSELLLSISLA